MNISQTKKGSVLCWCWRWSTADAPILNSTTHAAIRSLGFTGKIMTLCQFAEGTVQG
jgi:hypothetical protein